MNWNKFFIVLLGSLVMVATISCQKPFPSTINVIHNQQLIKSYPIPEIKKMPVRSFIKEGKIESGPSLSYLLLDAGFTKVKEVTVKNEKGESYQTSQIENLILDITNRGTVKLASETLSKNKWIKDISEIVVETQP